MCREAHTATQALTATNNRITHIVMPGFNNMRFGVFAYRTLHVIYLMKGQTQNLHLYPHNPSQDQNHLYVQVVL